MHQIPNTKKILELFKNKKVNKDSKDYLHYHSIRYNHLLKEVEKLRNELKDKKIRVLDIGAAYQTELLKNTFPELKINTIGFLDIRFSICSKNKHYEFDLNDAQFKNKWPKIKGYDLIIMAEVIEHLYTSPILVLHCINSWLKVGGYLIIQTPNTLALNRRLKLLLGKNPYEMIRENRINPGHFREYTLNELNQIATKTGYKIVNSKMSNYFNSPKIGHKLYNLLEFLIPDNLREGITITLQKT